jgi:serine/threonine protein kinase
MNVNRLKNLVGQKLDEFKQTATQNIQSFQRNVVKGTGAEMEWSSTDELNYSGGDSFPVDLPDSVTINGQTYKFIKMLDEGGYSFVFSVRNVATGEDYALKRLLLQEEEMLDSAMNEIKIMEKLSGHENIINFFGYKKLQKGSAHELYILMELAEGNTPFHCSILFISNCVCMTLFLQS